MPGIRRQGSRLGLCSTSNIPGQKRSIWSWLPGRLSTSLRNSPPIRRRTPKTATNSFQNVCLLGTFALHAGPVTGESDGVVANFVPGNGHGGRPSGFDGSVQTASLAKLARFDQPCPKHTAGRWPPAVCWRTNARRPGARASCPHRCGRDGRAPGLRMARPIAAARASRLRPLRPAPA